MLRVGSLVKQQDQFFDVMGLYKRSKTFQVYCFFVDFEKAFDSIDWDFMLKCLNVFGFKPSFKECFKTFFTNISRCIINNGMYTPYFEVQRGVRQGDPLSPYLFITEAEILAITFRSKTDIQGLKIGQEELKIVQYADDLTVVCAQS